MSPQHHDKRITARQARPRPAPRQARRCTRCHQTVRWARRGKQARADSPCQASVRWLGAARGANKLPTQRAAVHPSRRCDRPAGCGGQGWGGSPTAGARAGLSAGRGSPPQLSQWPCGCSSRPRRSAPPARHAASAWEPCLGRYLAAWRGLQARTRSGPRADRACRGAPCRARAPLRPPVLGRHGPFPPPTESPRPLHCSARTLLLLDLSR